MRLRLEQAREFLGQGYGVTEAAALAGFSDLSRLSRQYKRQFGASPSRQKRRQRGKPPQRPPGRLPFYTLV